MKKFVSLLLAMIMVLSLAACGAKEEAPASGGSAAEPIVLKLNHPSADGGPYDLMSKEFARLIEEKTEGRYKIEIYNSNALGTQEEALEACALGTMDMCVTSDDKLATYAPEWGYLGLPFIFEDVDDVAENMNGEMGAYLSGLLEDKGLMIMSFFENGFRNVTAHKPVNVPEDLKGVKIRSVTSQGASPSTETVRLPAPSLPPSPSASCTALCSWAPLTLRRTPTPTSAIRSSMRSRST